MKSFFRSAGIVMAVLASSASTALEYILESELRVSAQHDDNINLEVNNTNSLYGEVINPSANLAMRSENWSSALDVDLKFSDYNREGYGSDDQYVTWASTREGERYSFSLAASAVHDTTRTSEGTDSGRFSNSRRKFYSLTPNWSYYLTAKQLLTLQASLSTVDYEDPRYAGYDNGVVYAEWTYIFDEQWRVFIRANASDFESDGRSGFYLFEGEVTIPGFPFPVTINPAIEQTYFTETKSSGFQLGADYQVTEKLNLFGLFGNMNTDTEYTVETANDQCNSQEWTIRGICDLEDQDSSSKNTEVKASWEEERQTFSVRYNISSQPSSDGYLLEAERVDVSWNFELAERNTVGITATWGENKSLNDSDDSLQTNRSNREYTNAQIFYRYRLTEHWYVNANVRYRQQEREITPGVAEGWGGQVGVSYFPRKLQW